MDKRWLIIFLMVVLGIMMFYAAYTAFTVFSAPAS